MDLDLGQVRAFVTVAGHLHFGRAAEELSISQQAVSKRVARLESALGVLLFTRGNVELTEAGRRFLEPAREALRAAEAAAGAVHAAGRPLRIDVWGHLYGPARTVAPVIDELPGLSVELGMSRDLPAAAASLLRGDIDAAFGRVHPPLPDGLAHRLVRLEPVDVLAGDGHPLAGASSVRPSDLTGHDLWFPAAVDRLDFIRRFCDEFGVRAASGGANLGVEHLLADLLAEPGRITLFPADAPLPGVPGIRAIPVVDPTPLYAWSLVWPRQSPHPMIPALLRGFAEYGRRHRWLEYDPARDWLPGDPAPTS
ncbi:LysR family transcriptional regulator [Actinomadura darangshiensis]|uniref:LysR family transcriptional regulator n=1 Tax=Actinomadura darangshiensis TaxID=705336 RepID=A0A4R5B1U7_9ACTN|nr:LysR family transcriptional regulator [Actinomadura darangshiensis]TDD79105.1 LysR family transcriptional regulator [Actinomadura darangshiensis]